MLSHTSTNTNCFPKPPTPFLTCFSRGERRKYVGKYIASTESRIHNHQVMSLTHSQLSHPGGACSTCCNFSTVSWPYYVTIALSLQTVCGLHFVQKQVNSFPNKPWFSCVFSQCLLKTLREKEKLLITSNSSFSHSVFYPNCHL